MPVTKGVHHVGLTVSRLDESASFFTSILGWEEIRRDKDYPAIFVSDGSVMVTLWKSRGEEQNVFNKDTNVGLHHIALMVENEQELTDIYTKLRENDIQIEFSPEMLRQGPARHMMCYEPSGIRVEFIWPGE